MNCFQSDPLCFAPQPGRVKEAFPIAGDAGHWVFAVRKVRMWASRALCLGGALKAFPVGRLGGRLLRMRERREWGCRCLPCVAFLGLGLLGLTYETGKALQ